MNPLLLVDFYKPHHNKMYPKGMTLLYSNLTPRKSRISGVNHVVVFGPQFFIKEYLIYRFKKYFFEKPLDFIINQYKEEINIDTSHIEALHKLGYLPIEIKSLTEGSLCPIGVPCLTIKNTHEDFGWLVNYLETLLSCVIWQPMTSATISFEYKKLLTAWAIETTGSADGVQWQAHDFSMRGMSSPESAITSGMAHLLSFTGTDTIPAIYAHKKYYNATGLIGASVPATEHSVMCMGKKEAEIETFKRLLDLYPNGILSVVSDTWDLWKVLTEFLPQLKEQILARDGKLVIRPDSGDPVDIICGYDSGKYKVQSTLASEAAGEYLTEDGRWIKRPERKGVIELLWGTFGGTINKQGYKVLDPHIGAIYGDSITLDRAKEICQRLKAKGFASTNIVFGVGSYTYQYNTRDTFGFAMKATYGEVIDWERSELVAHGPGVSEWDIVKECREIFKDPITDDGTKRSKKGLLAVYDESFADDMKGKKVDLWVNDRCTWEQEASGLLKTVFKDGVLINETNLEEIRNRLILTT